MTEVLLSIEECLGRFLEQTQPVTRTERILIVDSIGRIAASDIHSPIDVPSFPRSAMDGYAVRSCDLTGASRENPRTLRVIGELFAGDFREFDDAPGTAVRVMTGALVPEGFDCVVKQEDTDYGDTLVKIFTEGKPFMNDCPVGEDMRAGVCIAKRGTRIGMAHIGAFAAAGLQSVEVLQQPRVCLLATGDEVIAPGEPLSPGKIYNSTVYMLASVIQKHGMSAEIAGNVGDDEEQLADALKKCAERSDIILTTGGVSVGKRDCIKRVLERIGAEILFTRADIQPGTPTVGSLYRGIPILSLSGNPYAALVNFEVYFWALAAKLTGDETLQPKRERLPLAEPYDKINRRRRFIRAYSDGRAVYLPEQNHAASVIANVTACNCFIDLEAGRKVRVGDLVRVQYMKE